MGRGPGSPAERRAVLCPQVGSHRDISLQSLALFRLLEPRIGTARDTGWGWGWPPPPPARGSLRALPAAVPPLPRCRDPGAGHGGQSGAAPSRRAETDAAVRDRRGSAGHGEEGSVPVAAGPLRAMTRRTVPLSFTAERVRHLQLPDEREAPHGRRPHPPAGRIHGAHSAARGHGLSASALTHPQRRGRPTPSAAAAGGETLQDGRWEPNCWLSAASRCWSAVGPCLGAARGEYT